MSARVVGMDRVLAKLQRLAGQMNGSQMLTAVMAGALVISNAAKEKAPYISGTLRRSIHVETGQVTTHGATATVGTDLEYAARIEFGFVGADSLGRVYNQAAQPYLRPALDENRDKAVRVMATAAGRLVRQAAK